ncbi:MAG TPA: SpoIIE family protein phosphatase [Phycisphaerae bacterium]|nr:SpoIIE family protein phosphatase [Phycisphaerae bacterium]
MRFRTILSLSLLLPLAATGAAVMSAMYISADRHSTEMGHKLLNSVTAQAADAVHAKSEQAVGLAHSLEQLGTTGLPLEDSDALALRLANLLRENPNITWISFSNPRGDFTGSYRRATGDICINQSHITAGKTALIENTLDAANHKTLLRTNPDTGYDPRTRPFYMRAVENKSLVWLPPYIFYEQGIPGITCAAPVYDNNKNLLGVFSVDYDLNYLSELARHLAATRGSQVMVFTDDYLLLAHSALHLDQRTGNRDYGKLMTPADVTDPTTQSLLAHLKTINLEQLPTGTARELDFRDSRGKQIACILPTRLESGPVMYVATVAPKTDFAATPWESSKYAFSIVLAAFALAAGLAIVIAKRISNPITTLVQASERIGKGDLDVPISLGPIREFRKLAAALKAMLVNLRESVRVRDSLHLAQVIQRRLLPVSAPNIPGFDIAGFSESCDETGGDYFDFLIPDPANSPASFILALGDMMGHGLPSALMMAGVRGGLRSALAARSTPAALLIHMNRIFFRDTEGCQFMTMCLASFDLTRGELLWASAGHEAPLIYDPELDQFHEPEGGDVPLGVLEHVHYIDYCFSSLRPGQLLFIGSDGVWETSSPDRRHQFGKERLKDLLAEYSDRPVDEIKARLVDALAAFRGTGPVRDDITFILLKILPVPANTESSASRRETAEAFAI